MLAPVGKGIENLLALASHLEDVHATYKENDYDHGYYQTTIQHPCGTPACAIGHYLELRGMLPEKASTVYIAWENKEETNIFEDRFYANLAREGHLVFEATDEFDLTEYEARDLFDFEGCGDARTALQAANYIRDFVARKIEALVT